MRIVDAIKCMLFKEDSEIGFRTRMKLVFPNACASSKPKNVKSKSHGELPPFVRPWEAANDKGRVMDHFGFGFKPLLAKNRKD